MGNITTVSIHEAYDMIRKLGELRKGLEIAKQKKVTPETTKFLNAQMEKVSLCEVNLSSVLKSQAVAMNSEDVNTARDLLGI